MISSDLKKADKLLYQLGKRIEILDKIRWPDKTKNIFLKSWKVNNPKIPKIEYKKADFENEKSIIKEIKALSKEKSYLANFISETTESFRLAIDMMEQRGKVGFLDRSIELYGTPSLPFRNFEKHNALSVAKTIIKRINKFDLEKIVPMESYCILASSVKDEIDSSIKESFPEWKINVKVDKHLKAKAAANINRVRIRENCCFASYDIKQLLQHEIFVHILTLKNGRKQKLKTFGIASPRTTTTQEGLAVFSEFITGAIDIVRLLRISARVVAIDMALSGANFIEVFKYFLENGQNEDESYYSTARVFRGGNPKGGLAFTKDAVYLRGLIEVHNFFIRALRNNKYEHTRYLFAGRMKTTDVSKLEPYFLSGKVKKPIFEPMWLREPSLFLAFLLSSNIMNSLGLSKLKVTK